MVGVPGFYPILRREVGGCVILGGVMHSLRARIAVASLVAALAAVPAQAQAATLTGEKPCYAATDPPGDLMLIGTGYAPSSLVLLSSGGSIIGTAVTKADGTFRQKYQIPGPPQTGKDAHEAQFSFTATGNDDPSLTASVTFSTANVFGDFSPGTSLHPETVRVRFSAFGFGAGLAAGAQMPTVYLHYVNPRGTVKKTITLGRGQGVCGSIRKTQLRRLFPFKPTRGKWTLQFDTRKVYKRGTSATPYPYDRSLTLTLS